MRNVSDRAPGMGTQRNELIVLGFGQHLLEMRQSYVHSFSAVAHVESPGLRRRLDEIEDDAQQRGHEFIHIQYSSPVVARNATVAEAGGASSAPGGGHA